MGACQARRSPDPSLNDKSIFNADNIQITDFVQFLSKTSSPHGAPRAANLVTLPCIKKTKKCKKSAKSTLISPLLMLTPAFCVHISYINMFMSDITWQRCHVISDINMLIYEI